MNVVRMVFGAVLCTGLAAAGETKWDEGFADVTVRSTKDGTEQPCRFYAPKDAAGKVPLLVALHTWSYDWKAKSPAEWALGECRRRGRPVDWTLPATGKGTELEATK